MIQIRNLTKRYGNFAAVDGISLTARPGFVFGFLGPNGAGKTTTIRILAGLSLPSSGEVSIGGFDVVREPKRTKSITGFIPDRPYLYEKLTGRELLAFVAGLYHSPATLAAARGESLAAYFQLGDRLDDRIENYSHGMKQKLVLIASMIHDPAVLVIDEPMVGLDALAQRQVKELLRRMAAEGKTVFLTTHTMAVAEAVCDEIAILHHGRIVAAGSTEEILRSGGRGLEELFLELTFDPLKAGDGADDGG